MTKENMNKEFRLKKIDEKIHYLIEEINQNKLLSKKHKKICTFLNCVDHSLIIIFTITALFPFLFLLLYLVFHRNYRFCNCSIKNLCNN